MLNRLYVDNYKSLVNFELKPSNLCLLLGANGTGKTTVMEVLGGVKALLLASERVADAFPTSTLTRWDTRDIQTIGIEVELRNQGTFYYYLQLIHDRVKSSSHILLETLQHDGHFLFQFEEGKLSLYQDDYRLSHEFYWDNSYTGLGKIVDRPENRKLTRFLSWMSDVTCVTIDPSRMQATAGKEESEPSPRLENFAAWLRHLSQERMEDMDQLKEFLSEIIELKSFALKSYGETVRQLRFFFPLDEAMQIDLSLDELSDGQRALMALYALLVFQVKPDSLLFIDEPDNFVTLREIQPWLAELQMSCEDRSAQAILISHGSEVINYFASSYGIGLHRLRNGPTVAREFHLEDDVPFTPAEAIARGAYR